MGAKGTARNKNVPLRLAALDGRMAICRLPADAGIPAQALEGDFFSMTRTPEELSIVCPEENAPDGSDDEVMREDGWRALKLEGPFDLSLVGVLVSATAPLAGAGLGVFAVSTYSTDYVLVEEENLDAAVAALREAGHEVL